MCRALAVKPLPGPPQHLGAPPSDAQMPNGDRYEGYFKDGLRQGRGTLLYNSVKMHYNRLTLKTRYTGHKRYEGLWRAGDIRARGVHTDIVEDNLFFTTNNRNRLCCRIN